MTRVPLMMTLALAEQPASNVTDQVNNKSIRDNFIFCVSDKQHYKKEAIEMAAV